MAILYKLRSNEPLGWSSLHYEDVVHPILSLLLRKSVMTKTPEQRRAQGAAQSRATLKRKVAEAEESATTAEAAGAPDASELRESANLLRRVLKAAEVPQQNDGQ